MGWLTISDTMTRMAGTVRPEKTVASVHARRVIFIDLARALAVLFMLYGHTVDALLAPSYRSGLVYDTWQFQRGLTSCLFLLLSGFAFSIATARHWTTQISLSAAQLKRLRRFGLFVLLGYALRIPVTPLSRLATATPDEWRSLLAVDVLQLIGVTFVGIQALVMLTRSRVLFTWTTLVLGVAIACATPFVWSTTWTPPLPLWLSSYLTPASGSQFPLFPWAVYMLIGAGLGQIYAHWGALDLGRYANVVLLVPGVVALILSRALASVAGPLFGTGPFNFVPDNVLLRTGACFLLLGVIAHASRLMTRLPHVFGAVAQETLLIYFVHLCIVYGSIWSPGLSYVYGMTRTPGQTVLIVLMIVASMTLLAWYWNWWKHTRPHAAPWVSAAVGVMLIARLFFS